MPLAFFFCRTVSPNFPKWRNVGSRVGIYWTQEKKFCHWRTLAWKEKAAEWWEYFHLLSLHFCCQSIGNEATWTVFCIRSNSWLGSYRHCVSWEIRTSLERSYVSGDNRGTTWPKTRRLSFIYYFSPSELVRGSLCQACVCPLTGRPWTIVPLPTATSPPQHFVTNFLLFCPAEFKRWVNSILRSAEGQMSVGSVEKAALRHQAHVGEFSTVTQEPSCFVHMWTAKEKKKNSTHKWKLFAICWHHILRLSLLLKIKSQKHLGIGWQIQWKVSENIYRPQTLGKGWGVQKKRWKEIGRIFSVSSSWSSPVESLTPGTVAIKQQTPATGKMLLIAAMSCIYQPLDIVHRNAADMCFSIAYAARALLQVYMPRR